MSRVRHRGRHRDARRLARERAVGEGAHAVQMKRLQRIASATGSPASTSASQLAPSAAAGRAARVGLCRSSANAVFKPTNSAEISGTPPSTGSCATPIAPRCDAPSHPHGTPHHARPIQVSTANTIAASASARGPAAQRAVARDASPSSPNPGGAAQSETSTSPASEANREEPRTRSASGIQSEIAIP